MKGIFEPWEQKEVIQGKARQIWRVRAQQPLPACTIDALWIQPNLLQVFV